MISIENLHKTYEMGAFQVHALRGVNLEIEKGEYVAIMGPSGSGKSTLMHILGCLDRPTKGSYNLNGSLVETLDDEELSRTRNREIGFVFQSFNLLPAMTVQQNTELPMIYANSKPSERSSRANKVLELVGLSDRVRHLPNELSGGQRQRVAIARALVNDPAILLADEPTGNLDSKTGVEILALFQELNERGRTILLVTHEREVAENANRIIHIKDGVVNEIEVLREPLRVGMKAEG
ncbi:MAG: ABC transporter ATP-binding protein [Candidatus Sumerlaeia bacterium]|nr:ABC transporter ATP-binding protein [Candidatus Sumerlaeia bacterium]